MKTIPLNKITAVSASSQDTDYVAGWVLYTTPEKAWRSMFQTGTLTLTVSEGNCVFLGHHTADRITVTIKTTGGGTIAGPFETDYSGQTHGNDSLWREYPAQASTHLVECVMETTRANRISVGVAWAGTIVEMRNPRGDCALSYRDHSIGYVMSAGNRRQAEKGRLRRVFSFSCFVPRDEARDMLLMMKNSIDLDPIPFMIVDDRHETHAVFGSVEALPSSDHAARNNSALAFEVVEA